MIVTCSKMPQNRWVLYHTQMYGNKQFNVYMKPVYLNEQYIFDWKEDEAVIYDRKLEAEEVSAVYEYRYKPYEIINLIPEEETKMLEWAISIENQRYGRISMELKIRSIRGDMETICRFVNMSREKMVEVTREIHERFISLEQLLQEIEDGKYEVDVND